jgi:hypothetical protein
VYSRVGTALDRTAAQGSDGRRNRTLVDTLKVTAARGSV